MHMHATSITHVLKKMLKLVHNKSKILKIAELSTHN